MIGKQPSGHCRSFVRPLEAVEDGEYECIAAMRLVYGPGPAGSTLMKRFESGIRTIITLYAALLGFGLKKMLDDSTSHAAQGWMLPGFAMTLLMFASFLVGATNLLWAGFVHSDTSTGAYPRSTATLLVEFLFLIALGFAGMAICYSGSYERFLIFHALFGLLAIMFCTYYRLRNSKDLLVSTWFWCNFVHVLLPLVLLTIHSGRDGAVAFIWSIGTSIYNGVIACPAAWAGALVYAVVMVFDLREQLNHLKRIG